MGWLQHIKLEAQDKTKRSKQKWKYIMKNKPTYSVFVYMLLDRVDGWVEGWVFKKNE